MQETWVWSLGWEDTLEEGMATHFSILAWRIPGTEQPDELLFVRVSLNIYPIRNQRWEVKNFLLIHLKVTKINSLYINVKNNILKYVF